MKTILVFCVILYTLASITDVCAQTPLLKDVYTYRNVVGISVSSATGYGLSYQRRISDDFRLKTVLYYYMSQNGDKTSNEFNSAIEGQFDMIRDVQVGAAFRIFLLGSARYHEDKLQETQSFVKNGMYFDSTVTRDGFINNYSFGLGGEILISNRINVNIEICYGYRGERKIPAPFNEDYPRKEILPSIGFEVGFMF